MIVQNFDVNYYFLKTALVGDIVCIHGVIKTRTKKSSAIAIILDIKQHHSDFLDVVNDDITLLILEKQKTHITHLIRSSNGDFGLAYFVDCYFVRA